MEHRTREAKNKKAKQLLTTSQILTHLDSDEPLILACDTSTYGIRAVLSHIVDKNMANLIAYALHSLSTTERMQVLSIR